MVPRAELSEDQRQLPSIFLYELDYPLLPRSVEGVRHGRHGAGGSTQEGTR